MVLVPALCELVLVPALVELVLVSALVAKQVLEDLTLHTDRHP